MIITKNNIIDGFRSFADGHQFLTDFDYGPTYEIGTSRQMTFPYMWVSEVPSTLDIGGGSNIVPNHSYNIFFLDQVSDAINPLDGNGLETTNAAEVMSDTFQYAQDFIIWFQSVFSTVGAKLSPQITYTPVFDETQDKVYGYFITISFRTVFKNCVLPWEEE